MCRLPIQDTISRVGLHLDVQSKCIFGTYKLHRVNVPENGVQLRVRGDYDPRADTKEARVV